MIYCSLWCVDFDHPEAKKPRGIHFFFREGHSDGGEGKGSVLHKNDQIKGNKISA